MNPGHNQYRQVSMSAEPTATPIRATRAVSDGAKSQRSEMILICAAKMLTETGVDGLKMAELAARCNLAKGTLYLYYPTKDALLLALLADVLDDWRSGVCEQLQPDLDRSEYGRVLSDAAMKSPVLLALCGWAAGYGWQSDPGDNIDVGPLHVTGNHLGLHLATLLGLGSRPGRRLGFGIIATLLGAQCMSGGDTAAFGRVFTPAVNQMLRGYQAG